MIDTPEITDTTAQPAAVIRLTIPRDQIQNVMGPGIQEIMSSLADQGVAPAGPWFTHHLTMQPETFDFEIGVPVDAPVTPIGRMTPGELPAARVARAVYRGPYDGLSSAWSELDAWITEQGLSTRRDVWERYLTGPESSPDPSTWRTELNKPLAGD